MSDIPRDQSAMPAMNAGYPPSSPRRIAIVHDWLDTFAGSERVLEQILLCYPNADLFVVVDFLADEHRHILQGIIPQPSMIQRLPMARKRFRAYLPLMPLAVEQFDLSAYDLVISSSHAVSKGVLTGPEQWHVSYVHSPMRYAWDGQHLYLRDSGLAAGAKSWLARWILHRLRIWDVRTANRVDSFVANSTYIARRIAKTYGRPARVISPPVDVGAFELRPAKDDFYVTASRFVPYKKIDLIAEAFRSLPDRRLIIIGDGPDRQRIAAKCGSNVTLLGHQPFPVLRDHMQRARAFLFAAEEDFGIVPVEAQACGTPVIAFGRGGVLDSIQGLDADQPTGVFFYEQTADAIADAIRRFERDGSRISAAACRANALDYSPERFRAKLMALMAEDWARFTEIRRGKHIERL